MWGTNSLSQRYQSNNKISYELGRNTLIQNQANINNNNSNELNLFIQTPIKQLENIQNNNNYNNITPFRFDFNYYFGNLWSAGHIPNNQLLEQNINLSPTQLIKENLFFCKKSIEKSYKLTPISPPIKDNGNSQNNSNNSLNNYNSNTIVVNQNNNNLDNNNKTNEPYNIDNNSNMNINDLTKRNLLEVFNNAKNEQFLNDSHKEKRDSYNAMNKNININNKNELKNEIRKKNCNLQISHQIIFSSPRSIKKPKKLFECSGSTFATSSNKCGYKKRRFRKNNEQLSLLKKFYNEHKYWSKNQIKDISKKIGLKENKVYKWLWDQRNKEIKAAKFVVKKGNDP